MAGKRKASKSFNRAQGRELTVKTFPMPADTVADDFISAGWMLSQMDLAGGRRAHRYINGRCVTIGIEAMSFHKPIYVGDEVSVFTKVLKQGTTSLRLKVEAHVRRRRDGSEEKVTEGEFTFVAIDDQRRPVPIENSHGKRSRMPEGKLTAAARSAKTQPAAAPCQIFNGQGCDKNKTLSLRTVPEPRDTNYNGDIFGGWILAQMDKACANTASQFSGHRVATVGLEAMKFISPVFVGDEISFYTEVVSKGRTSVTVKVESWAQRRQGQIEKVTEGLFTYVAIDKNRKPVVIKAEP